MSTSPDIRALRAALGWSQERMAQHLRVHQSTISFLENGKGEVRGPMAVLLEQLAANVNEAGSAQS